MKVRVCDDHRMNIEELPLQMIGQHKYAYCDKEAKHTQILRDIKNYIGIIITIPTKQGKKKGKIVSINDKTIWVKLEDGNIIKRHYKKHSWSKQ